MTARPMLALALISLAAVACQRGNARTAGTTATVTVRDLAGAEVGQLRLEDTPAGLLLTGTLTGLGAGTRAIHLHQTGRCEPPFATAGGHFNPGDREHGFRNQRGHHAGDLPNITVPVGVPAVFDMLISGVTLDGPNGLLDADGTALVVHASGDDYSTDPAGNAGDRIACGVVER